jgi:hypothetical protein
MTTAPRRRSAASASAALVLLALLAAHAPARAQVPAVSLGQPLPDPGPQAPGPLPYHDRLLRPTAAEPAAPLRLPEPCQTRPFPCGPEEPDSGWLTEEPLLENLSLFGGLDGAKGPEDLGINANFGFRGAVQWGVPLIEELNLGLQIGTAVNYSRTAVRVLRTVDGTRERTQSFSTIGLFQRTDEGLVWGVAWDYLAADYWTGMDLSQVRGQVGYQLTDNDEVGVWGTMRDRGDHAEIEDFRLRLRAINQVAVYWRHVWENGSVTRAWAGVAEEHGRFVLTDPGQPSVNHPFLFGADLHIPLNDSLAIYGEANFITPNDTGTVTATLGLAWYPGRGAARAARSRYAPVLPLANNTSFAVDLRQE